MAPKAKAGHQRGALKAGTDDLRGLVGIIGDGANDQDRPPEN